MDDTQGTASRSAFFVFRESERTETLPESYRLFLRAILRFEQEYAILDTNERRDYAGRGFAFAVRRVLRRHMAGRHKTSA